MSTPEFSDIERLLGEVERARPGTAPHLRDAPALNTGLRYVGDPNGPHIKCPPRAATEQEFDEQAEGLRCPQFTDKETSALWGDITQGP